MPGRFIHRRLNSSRPALLVEETIPPSSETCAEFPTKLHRHLLPVRNNAPEVFLRGLALTRLPHRKKMAPDGGHFPLSRPSDDGA